MLRDIEYYVQGRSIADEKKKLSLFAREDDVDEGTTSPTHRSRVAYVQIFPPFSFYSISPFMEVKKFKYRRERTKRRGRKG